jgi:hypothetical protein
MWQYFPCCYILLLEQCFVFLPGCCWPLVVVFLLSWLFLFLWQLIQIQSIYVLSSKLCFLYNSTRLPWGPLDQLPPCPGPPRLRSSKKYHFSKFHANIFTHPNVQVQLLARSK